MNFSRVPTRDDDAKPCDLEVDFNVDLGQEDGMQSL